MSKRKERFIRALAEFLCKDSARKSIELELGKESAQEWALLRAASPIFGYVSVEEAEERLREFFS